MSFAMTLISELPTGVGSMFSLPRPFVWTDLDYQFEKGQKLGRHFRASLASGFPLQRSPILPGVSLFTQDSKKFMFERTSIIQPNEEHPFTVGFVNGLELESAQMLVEGTWQEAPIVYLAGGYITFEQISTGTDYTDVELDSMRDGVFLPAIRVVHVPEVL